MKSRQLKRRLEIEPFGLNLWLVVGWSRNKLLRWVLRSYGSSLESLDTTFAAISALLNSNDLLVYIPMLSGDKMFDIGTVIHEATHTAKSALGICGIDDEECLAYLVECLAVKILKAL